jgi:chemotaxis protein CheD
VKAPEDVLEVFLQPGEFYFGEERTRVSTLLGSCVAITLWHPGLHIGGMCHYLLPRRSPHAAGPTGPDLDGRYGDEAMALFLREIHLTRTRPGEYRMKIFGGGSLLATGGEERSIPRQNADMARELAMRHELQIESEDIGGTMARYVMLDLWSGDVWVRRGPRSRHEGAAAGGHGTA